MLIYIYVYGGGLEQVMQDEMLSEAAITDGTDFMAGLEDLICRDDAAQMPVIW